MPRKRNPLVCQHIENLSSDALEAYASIIREIVGRRHGVYALYKKKKLYYVGLATNLRNRLKAHLRNKHKGYWDRFSVYLTIDSKHLKELESLLIRIAQPKGNSQGGGFARSENLTRTLRRRLREQQREQWLRVIGESPLRAVDDDDDGRKPVLASYTKKRFKLRATYRGKKIKASVRSDGTIRVGKKIFNSPSMAASEVVRGATNGWGFWMYERAPGQWVKLREMKRR